MTFTDNAAAELRMRVAHRLMKARRTAEQEGDDNLAERAITAMSHLPSAPIGTIHSFCTRLLREHALEAGLSPGFSVLVGDEHDELLEQISRDLLLKQLEADADFRDFCAGVNMAVDALDLEGFHYVCLDNLDRFSRGVPLRFLMDEKRYRLST